MPSVTRLLELGVTAAVTGYVYRDWRGRSVERAFDVRFAERRNAQGVIAGAEPFTLKGDADRAIVLFHGYNDSPQAVRSPAAAFHAAGWTVYAPLFPGHGRSLRAFAASGAEMWIKAGRDAVREALTRHRSVSVGGLSMGGAIAAITAAEQPTVRAAALFAPFFVHSRRLGWMAASWPLLTLGARYLTGGNAAKSVRDPEARARIIAYGCSTPRLLREVQRVTEVAWQALPRVRQPVWIAQSSDDYRIPPTEAQAAFDRLGASDKHLHWTNGNGHVITMDFGHEQLSAEAVRWMAHHTATA